MEKSKEQPAIIRRSFVVRVEKYSESEKLKDLFPDLPSTVVTHYDLHKQFKNFLQYSQADIACQRQGQIIEKEVIKIEEMI